MGIKKYIETPEKLLELFIEYKVQVKSNPRLKHVFVGKEGHSTYEELERPLTMEGFENYVCDKGLNTELSHYFSNKDGRYSDYVAVCSRIRQNIRQDQIEGGMVGQYNASITQRLNGLKDQSEIELKKEPRVFNID
jgi:hypothetical protein